MAEPVKLKTYADYQKYNFFRSPAWRWDRVLSLVDRDDGVPGRCTRRDDEFVRTARSFVLKWQNGDDDMKEKLLWENPGLYYAYDFQQRVADDPEAAMYIQARLLARLTPAEVADTMGMMPDAIEWYARLFFDVLPYLDKRDWITKQVLVPSLMRAPVKAEEETGFKDSTVARPMMDGSLKLFAYFGGKHLVDLMIHGMQVGKPVTSPEDAANWLDNNISQTIKARTAQASRLFEINKYNVMELFTIHNQILAIEKSEENQDQTKSTQERHIKAMIDEIPWAVGSDGEKLYGGSTVGRFDNMASELRDDELILIASGRKAPTIADHFPDKLPEPRRTKKSALTSEDVDLT